MPRTQTISGTRTYLRIELLKIQVKIAIQRAVQPSDLSAAGMKSIMVGLDKEWIEWVRIFGIDSTGEARCELALRIDWSRYQVHINAGRTTVEVDDRWPGNTSLELHNYLELFNEFVRSNRLKTQWQVSYRSGLTGDINQALGLVNATPVKWATGRDGVTNVVPELDELSVGFWMVT